MTVIQMQPKNNVLVNLRQLQHIILRSYCRTSYVFLTWINFRHNKNTFWLLFCVIEGNITINNTISLTLKRQFEILFYLFVISILPIFSENNTRSILWTIPKVPLGQIRNNRQNVCQRQYGKQRVKVKIVITLYFV